MRNRFRILGWLLLAASTPGLAQAEDSQAASAPQKSDKYRLAMEMAEIGFSDAAFDKQLEVVPKQIATGLMQDPDSAALELEYPGIIEFMVAAILPPIAEGAKAGLPNIRSRLALIYAENLETAELSNLLEFYQSPTGAKLIGHLVDNADFSAIINESIAQGENTQLSEDSVSQSMQASAATFVGKGLTKAERIAFMKFALTPEFKKLKIVNPLLLTAVTNWMNEPMPQAEAQAEAQAIDAIAEYMDARDNDREPELPSYTKDGG